MRISDWSSDVCSSDLVDRLVIGRMDTKRPFVGREQFDNLFQVALHGPREVGPRLKEVLEIRRRPGEILARAVHPEEGRACAGLGHRHPALIVRQLLARLLRSEEHTSELQSLMRISYAVFCLKKKKTTKQNPTTQHNIRRIAQRE